MNGVLNFKNAVAKKEMFAMRRVFLKKYKKYIAKGMDFSQCFDDFYKAIGFPAEFYGEMKKEAKLILLELQKEQQEHNYAKHLNTKSKRFIWF